MARREPKSSAHGPRERALGRALLGWIDGDLEAAERELAALVREDSNDVLAYLALGRIYRERGEVGRALRVHQNLALRRDLPSDLRSRARLALAEDLRAGGYRERAIAAYREVLASEPRNAAAIEALAQLCAEAGEPEAALPAVRAARGWLERGPHAANAAALEAELTLEQARREHAAGRSGAARKLARRAAKLDPGAGAPHVLLGDLERERGRGDAALAAWTAAVGLAGAGDDALFERIRAGHAAKSNGRLGRSKGDGGEGFLRAHLEAHPGDAAARRSLARVLAGASKVDDARAVLEHALALDPADDRSRAQLGRLLVDEGRGDEALALFADWMRRVEQGEEAS